MTRDERVTGVQAQPWTFWDAAHQHYLRWAGIPLEYDVRAYLRAARDIAASDMSRLTDDELAALAISLRDRVRTFLSLQRGDDGTDLAADPDRGTADLRTAPQGGTAGVQEAGEDRFADHVLADVFAVAAEASARLLGMRPFDVQLAAGIALHRGHVAQLATGEGKTLVAVFPAILNALSGRGVHIFTANDYLARRDAEWMGPVYRFFGLEAAFVAQGMTQDERRRAYAADLTYVTAKEAGFDFLRDHTALDPARTVQRLYHYVIVDEADFILIDEARVPLVIAGMSPPIGIDHAALARVAGDLRPGVDYEWDEYQRTVVLTETGFRRAGAMLRADLQHTSNRLLLSGVHVALHAQALLQRDRDYIVRDGRIELVDEFTGRVAENRRWPHGIQSAVEAKERVEVRPEGEILGSIPIQHFVRLYPKIAGMTATAVPAASEFKAFFGLTTVVFPPNQPCQRDDADDVVFTHREAKLKALLTEIENVHASGRPILVGTASVVESEQLAVALHARGIECVVLNARYDASEARIVSQAGMPGAVTISTNMAGRGTDIMLGGGDPALRVPVAALGGLYVIGTNRHESRRIDDQLRGRSGRQGDPGASRFFISLQDDLIQRYGVVGLIPRDHRPVPGDAPVADPTVHREIARAQRIIEGQNFEIRKTLWRYSQMVDEQRRMVYERRQAWMTGDGAGVCEAAAPKQYARLVEAAGGAAVGKAERGLLVHMMDRAWVEHLALIEDIREGIHLQRLGGREPLTEFQRQIIQAFAAMMDRVEGETVAAFNQLTVNEKGEIDLSRAGIGGSSSTWTYLINDNPFSTLGLSLLASRTLTSAVGVLALMYWPLTLLVSVRSLWQRARRRKARRQGLEEE